MTTVIGAIFDVNTTFPLTPTLNPLEFDTTKSLIPHKFVPEKFFANYLSERRQAIRKRFAKVALYVRVVRFDLTICSRFAHLLPSL